MIYIGKVSNTHGLKGEIRILSDFKYKDIVFKEGNSIYIMNEEYIINSYRVHKMYDMLTLKDLNTIEDVLIFKGEDVYINESDYEFPGYLDTDLIGLNVFDGNVLKGKVVDLKHTDIYDLLVIEGSHIHMVPNIDKFVKNVDLENNKIEIEYIKGLDNED